MSVVSFNFYTSQLKAPEKLTATTKITAFSKNGETTLLLHTEEGPLIEVLDVNDLINMEAGHKISVNEQGRIINHFRVGEMVAKIAVGQTPD